MKTTIKLAGGRALVVSPAAGQGVRVDLTFAGVVVGGDVLTPDQVGALLFGIEQAAEAAGIAADREAVSEGTESARTINAAPLAMPRRRDTDAGRCDFGGICPRTHGGQCAEACQRMNREAA